jgi:hypothetical protein
MKIAQPTVSDKGLPFARVSLITQNIVTIDIITYTTRIAFERTLGWDSGKLSSP